MKSISIKTNEVNLLNYINNELRCSDIDDICFCTKKFNHYSNIIIHYNGKNIPYFVNKISSILSFLVIDELEEDLIRRLISQHYFYFYSNDRNKILKICFDIISDNFNLYFTKKFDCLYEQFYNYLSCNKSIVLNGFVNFRLKNYFKFLNDIVEESVNTFIIEKEYLEFISLLRLYINSQPTASDIIHLIYSSSDSILLDENSNIIEKSRELLDNKFLGDISFSSNDFTLNSLLNLLPKKIFVHLIDNFADEFINTIELIFEDKVKLCTNCDVCKIYRENKINITHNNV